MQVNRLQPSPPRAKPRASQSKPNPWDDPRPWESFQRPTKLVGWQGPTVALSPIRWGFDEVGANPDDWPPHFYETLLSPGRVKAAYLGVQHFRGLGHSFLVLEFPEDAPLTAANEVG